MSFTATPALARPRWCPTIPRRTPSVPFTVCLCAVVFAVSPTVVFTEASAAPLDPAFEPRPSSGTTSSSDEWVFGSYFHFARSTLDPQNLIGLDAALLEQNEKGGVAGRMLRTELPGPSTEPSLAKRFANFAARSVNYTAVLMSSATLVQAVPSFAAAGLPIFGPNIAGEAFANESTPNAENYLNLLETSTSFAEQVVNYATRSQVHAKKFLIIHAPAFDTWPAVAAVTAKLTAVGLDKPYEIAVPAFNTSASIAGAEQIISKIWADTETTPAELANGWPGLTPGGRLPQAVILLLDEDSIKSVVNKLFHDPRVDKDSMRFFTSGLIAANTWTNATGSAEPFQNLYHALGFPHYLDTAYDVVKNYQAAMTRAFTVYNDTNYRNTSIPYAKQFGYDSLNGYVTGRLAIEALRRVELGTDVNRTTVLSAVYRTRFFEIDDLEIGPFSNGCVGKQTNAIAACWCNTGQRKFFMTKVNAVTGAQEPIENDAEHYETNVATVNIPMTSCAFNTSHLIRQRSHVVLPKPHAIAGSEQETRLVIQADHRLSLAREVNSYRPVEVFPIKVDTDLLKTRKETMSNSRYLAKRYSVRAILSDDIKSDDHSSHGVTPRLSLGRYQYKWPEHDLDLTSFEYWTAHRLEIPMYPVLADFAHTAVAFADSVGQLRNIHLITDTVSMTKLCIKSLHTFGVAEAKSQRILAISSSISGSALSDAEAAVAATITLPSSGVVIVSTQNEAALRRVQQLAAAAAAAGATASTLTVVMATSEFVLEATRDPIAAEAAGPVIRFVSGLRSYGEFENASVAYGDFMADVLTSTLGDTPTDGINDFIFLMGRIATTTAALGPLSATPCSAASIAENVRPRGSVCQCNKGITQYHIRPLSDWANHSAAASEFSLTHSGCGVEYQPLPESDSGLTGPALIGTIAGGVAGTTLIVSAVGVILFIAFGRAAVAASRQPKNAPQDGRKEFAMVFTDIQSSTALWAHAPQHMGEALDAHHAILRDLVADHCGYEVKTIGDSFMVAFKEAASAVRFALAVQHELYAHEWGTDLFDAAYREQLLDAGITTPQPAAAWRGLRVRVGVHYGIGDIKVDGATGGFDYYGTVVNTAARVEAVGHGGQVLVTDDCFQALGGSAATGTATESSGTLNLKSFTTDLGPQPLRGLDTSVRLHQIVPEVFSQRTFPALRLDKEAVIDEDGEDEEDLFGLFANSGTRRATDESDFTANSSKPTADNGDSSSVHSGRSKRHRYSTETCDMTPFEAITRRMSRKMRIKSGSHAVALAYRIVETMLSTTTQKARATLISDVAKRWRVPHPLPKWAHVDASLMTAAGQNGLMASANNGRMSELNLGQTTTLSVGATAVNGGGASLSGGGGGAGHGSSVAAGAGNLTMDLSGMVSSPPPASASTVPGRPPLSPGVPRSQNRQSDSALSGGYGSNHGAASTVAPTAPTPPRKRNATEDKIAGLTLFTVARVLSTVEALPSAQRPLLLRNENAMMKSPASGYAAVVDQGDAQLQGFRNQSPRRMGGGGVGSGLGHSPSQFPVSPEHEGRRGSAFSIGLQSTNFGQSHEMMQSLQLPQVPPLLSSQQHSSVHGLSAASGIAKVGNTSNAMDPSHMDVMSFGAESMAALVGHGSPGKTSPRASPRRDTTSPSPSRTSPAAKYLVPSPAPAGSHAAQNAVSDAQRPRVPLPGRIVAGESSNVELPPASAGPSNVHQSQPQGQQFSHSVTLRQMGMMGDPPSHQASSKTATTLVSMQSQQSQQE